MKPPDEKATVRGRPAVASASPMIEPLLSGKETTSAFHASQRLIKRVLISGFGLLFHAVNGTSALYDR